MALRVHLKLVLPTQRLDHRPRMGLNHHQVMRPIHLPLMKANHRPLATACKSRTRIALPTGPLLMHVHPTVRPRRDLPVRPRCHLTMAMATRERINIAMPGVLRNPVFRAARPKHPMPMEVQSREMGSLGRRVASMQISAFRHASKAAILRVVSALVCRAVGPRRLARTGVLRSHHRTIADQRQMHVLRRQNRVPKSPRANHKRYKQPIPYKNLPSLYDLYTQIPSSGGKLQRFGSDAFIVGTGNANELPMDLPAGPDYVLGPGDGLIVNMWGGQSSRFERTIDRQGQIELPEAGTIMINGMTIAAGTECHPTGPQHAVSIMNTSRSRWAGCAQCGYMSWGTCSGPALMTSVLYPRR